MRRLWWALGVWWSGVAAAQDATVELHVTNVASSSGQLLVVLFAQEAGFPDHPEQAYIKQLATPVVGTTVVRFTGVPPGTYAGFVVHDENANGACDLRSPVPIPKEPFGATRDAKAMFGPPKFRDAVFTVTGGTVVERFKLVRW